MLSERSVLLSRVPPDGHCHGPGEPPAPRPIATTAVCPSPARSLSSHPPPDGCQLRLLPAGLPALTRQRAAPPFCCCMGAGPSPRSRDNPPSLSNDWDLALGPPGPDAYWPNSLTAAVQGGAQGELKSSVLRETRACKHMDSSVAWGRLPEDGACSWPDRGPSLRKALENSDSEIR